ncbi:MAG TPA: HAMP domain-containing sensor histidine kinase [Thermoanaerobaculia bacterium]|jgi:signal transduction histidine kinase|nr:HAMP domain-containing sensor histidine kinase [Thermoanaerobaculia bacterium]
MKGGTFGAIVVTVALATLLFHAVAHQVSSVFLNAILRPDLREVIERSLLDQKTLRGLDPANEKRYRRRFDDTQRLLNRIDVVAMNREQVIRRFELILSGTFGAILFLSTLLWTIRQRRNEERRRGEYLARLTSWQEASRRHAHEIKTPLTAARMEVDRLVTLTADGAAVSEVRRAAESVYEELDRIARFTKEFSSFATIGQPLLRPEALDRLLTQFCEMFAGAWPSLTLRVVAPEGPILVNADRDLLRQVLVNLCTNSAHATGGHGSVTFAITRAGERIYADVIDSGCGIAPALQPRIFEPYVTTREIGSGMGLGLPISRKILLDHGGDLTLLSSSPAGSTFRLTFVRAT